MAFKDLRQWIALLEEKGDLKRIVAEVDWDEEIGAITREISSRTGPALLFENIKDHRETVCHRLFTNGTGSKKRICHLLGLPVDTSNRDLVVWLKERFSSPVQPIQVKDGTVKENILKGDAIDLYQLPVPK